MTNQKARTIIRDLLDAGHNSDLAGMAAHEQSVDFVPSRQPGAEHSRMSLQEAERDLDEAIDAAWLALTGSAIPTEDDRVEFIYSEPEGV